MVLAVILSSAVPAAATRVYLRHAPRVGPPPLRVVVKSAGKEWANCVFSTVELAEQAPVGSPSALQFATDEPLWGRCFFPKALGANRPGDLYDIVTVDGRRAWEQAYETPIPPLALSHLVPYGVILRILFAGLSPGDHVVRIEGLRRAGKSMQRVYEGSFTLRRVR